MRLQPPDEEPAVSGLRPAEAVQGWGGDMSGLRGRPEQLNQGSAAAFLAEDIGRLLPCTAKEVSSSSVVSRHGTIAPPNMQVKGVVVLRCHKAKPFAQVDGLPVHLPAPNTVIRRGTGDR